MTPGQQITKAAENVLSAAGRFRAAARRVWGPPMREESQREADLPDTEYERQRDADARDPSWEQDAHSRNPHTTGYPWQSGE